MRPRRSAPSACPRISPASASPTAGEPTARALRDIGVNVELVAPGTGSGALADRLIGAGAGSGAVWLPQGEAARIELGERLRQAGAEVVVTVCHRTVPMVGLRHLLIPAFAERLHAVTPREWPRRWRAPSAGE